MKKYFTFEVQVLDDKNVRRRFRASNYQVGHRRSPRAARCSGAMRMRAGRPGDTGRWRRRRVEGWSRAGAGPVPERGPVPHLARHASHGLGAAIADTRPASQSTTRVKPFICTMPMRLDEGWNQIQFNLSDFTRRAYGTNYIETLRVQIHANCRIRRIYFSDRLYSEEELPPEFKLFLPIQKQAAANEYK